MSACIKYFCIAGLLAGVWTATAQTPPQERVETEAFITATSSEEPHRRVVVRHGATLGRLGDATFDFVASEMSFGGRIVKGAPYSAESVTETIQTLADGNRIVRKNSASVYRDSEGRTRREQTLAAIGPWAAAGEPPQTIFINDPVAGVNYILEPRNRTATKIALPKFEGKPGEQHFGIAIAARKAEMAAVRDVVTEFHHPIPGPAISRKPLAAPKVESLGKQIIEGISAEGTRTTMVIPAGEIGNERPLEVVSERWYSPELQTVVLSKNSDPRMGETIHRLTNILRTEPLRSLFEPPADYTISDKGPVIVEKIKAQREAAK